MILEFFFFCELGEELYFEKGVQMSAYHNKQLYKEKLR